MNDFSSAYAAQFNDPAQRVGATHVAGQGVHIRLWAPKAKTVAIEWVDGQRADLTRDGDYFTGLFPNANPSDKYWFHLDGKTRIADPAARFQPDDTNGPSAVFADDFAWTDATWRGVDLARWVIYEIHAGTFSPSHDFAGIIADLPRLRDLGVTTIELMPVSQFSGARNWGYDGVFSHSVQHSYGGPQKLKELVDACHAHGLAIILDVVFNHLGPEGNVLFQCAPYATKTYHTPWGDALNFDGEDSGEVRRYFLQAAWQWLTEFHFDGLRLDAVQMIFDNAPVSFLQELHYLKKAAETVRGFPLVLTGESDMNDARLLMPPEQNGHGLDAQWADDFHHALHATLTGEKDGYYADYGGIAQLAKIYERGVAFEGEYSPFRKRRHGRSYQHIAPKALIVESQNHDQIGNRLKGDRLITQIGFEKAKLAAAAVLLSPFTPFLFMGEEFACTQPFMYFVSHHDPELLEIIRTSRIKEWHAFGWQEDPADAGAQDTFDACVLRDKAPENGEVMTDFYRKLIAFSQEIRSLGRPNVSHDLESQQIVLSYGALLVLLSFSEQATSFAALKGAELVFDSSRFAATPHDIHNENIAPYAACVWRVA